MEESNLNENDSKLLSFCRDKPRSAGEISRFIKISPSSVSAKIDKLKKLDLINITVRGRGKKTLVRSKEGNKIKQFMAEALGELKNKGEMTLDEFNSLVPYNVDSPDFYDKFNAVLRVYHSDLVGKFVRISDKGKQFLSENEKK